MEARKMNYKSICILCGKEMRQNGMEVKEGVSKEIDQHWEFVCEDCGVDARYSKFGDIESGDGDIKENPLAL